MRNFRGRWGCVNAPSKISALQIAKVRPHLKRSRSSPESVIPDPLQRAMAELALLLIDQGLTAADLQQVMLKAFLQAATQRALMKNGRVNQSLVAIMTGLTRSEVRRHLDRNRVTPLEKEEHGARRVIAGWMRDPEFQDGTGKPKPLPINGAYGSFHSLAKLHSGDIPTKATLNELKRQGLVTVKNDTVQLKSEATDGKRRQGRVINAIAEQFSEILTAVGYPEARLAQLLHTDTVTIDALDTTEAEIIRQRATQNSRTMLAGLEASSRNPVKEARGKGDRAGAGRKTLKISVLISEYTSRK
ncbi:MAG: DUF6502 family protein [Steroidobacteraceae bacterium]